MSDRALGGTGLAIAALYAWQTATIEESFLSDPVGPKGFPYIIAALLALASLAIIIRPDASPRWPGLARLTEIAVAVMAMVAYGIMLPLAGFVPATMVAAGYFSWRLGARPVEAALAGVTISVGIYLVFHLALGLTLARGPLGF